jgi:hypothetical protein
MRKYSRVNNGFEVLLVKVDTLSKQLNVVPLHNKSAKETLRGFMEIVAQVGVVPKNLFSDKGTEFFNADFQAYCKEMGINHYAANDNKSGAAGAERAIRTLKSRIYRYMSSRTERPHNRYIDALPAIVQSINATVHRAIGMAPADVKPENVAQIRDKLYPEDCTTKVIKPKFKLGDVVRKQIQYAAFHKGYKGDQYTDELFKITHVLQTDPVTYKLAENNMQAKPEIMGSFYEQQLQLFLPKPIRPTSPSQVFEAEAEESEEEHEAEM